MAKFLSGRQKNIRIGISSYSENLTSLEVIGKVGIGTTNPTRTLDVNGEIRLRSGLYDFNNSVGTSTSVLISTGIGVSWIPIATAVNVTVVDYVSNAGVSTSVIGGIGSITQLQVTGVSTFTNGPILVGTATSTGTASQRLQVDGGAYVSGNLGIGTTNPFGSNLYSGLDVNRSNVKIFARNIGTASDAAVWAADQDYFATPSYKGVGIVKYGPGTAGTIFSSIPYADSGVLSFQNTATGIIYTNGQSPLIFGTFSSERARFDGLTGNFGIGTTNPTSKLHVVGDVRVSGVVTATTFVGALTGTATSISGGLAGNIVYQSTPNATAFLVNGTSGFVLQSNGVGNAPTWVASTPSSAVSGITIRDSNNSVVGTSGSVTQLTFGTGLSVTGTTGAAGIATITLSSNIVGTALSISGISTFTNGPVFIGTATATGTASQVLQVTGGAYVSGNLGIGTTTPGSKLTVIGNATITNPGANALAVRSGASGSYANFNIGRTTNEVSISVAGSAGEFANNASAGDAVIRTDSTGKLLFTNGASNSTLAVAGNTVLVGTISSTGTASQRLQVDGGAYVSGNLGIGTISPARPLHVNGTVRIADSAALEWGGTSAYIAGTSASNALLFNTSSVERVRIDSSGSVGIGTNNPSNRLTVYGTQSDTTPILSLLSGNTAAGFTNGAQIAFGYDGNTNYQHFIQTRHNSGNSSNAIDFYVSDGTQNNTLTSGSLHTMSLVSGSVGINTTNPTSTLQVSGTFYNSGIGTFANGNATYGTTSASSLELGLNNNSNAGTLKLWGTTTNAYGLIQATTNNLHIDCVVGGVYLNYYDGDFVSFGTGAGAESARFTGSTGTLTLGTITPTGTTSQRLQVDGGAYVSTRLGVGVTNPAANTQVAIAGTLGIDAVGNAGTRTLFTSSSSGFTLNHNDNSQITFQTLGVNRLTYSHSSNFWNIPSGTPFLVGTATSTGTASQVLQVTGGAYVSGSVGIGTTNPTSKLDVRGAITIGVGTVGINSVFSTTDIQSWYYTNKSKSVSGDDTAPAAVYVGASGTAMFMVGDTGNDINQYTLSTPYDVSTAGVAVTFFSTATRETVPTGIDFNPTGTKMFISGQTGVAPLSGDYVHEYSLSTAWNVAPSSVGYTTSYSVSAQDTAPQAVAFGDSGSKMYVVGSAGDAVYQYSLSTPYSIASGVTYDSKTLVLGTDPVLLETAPTDISFNSTGTVLWIVGSTNDRIYEFRLGTAWDISTAVFYGDVYIGYNETGVTGLHVIPEQNVAYIVGSTSDTVYQYSTNTPAIEIASSGISSVSSIVLNNETRVKDNLYVKGLAHFDTNIVTQGNIQVYGNATVAGTLTGTGALTLSGATGSNIVLGTNQTTATLIIGGASQTGTITLGQATVSQTTNIQAGVSLASTTKTINFGTGGASGSFTQINIGPTAGVGTVVINSGTNLLVGSTTKTGTASQPLQVTGGAYVSGSVGIGTTNPGYKLSVYGNAIKTSADGSPFAISSNDATNPFQLLIARSSSSVTKPYWSIDSVEQNVAYRNLSLLPSGGNVTIGSTLDTGTSGQVLQVAGINSSVYIGGNLGIGNTLPTSKLVVQGDGRFVSSGQGDVTITHSSLVSTIKGTATVQLALGSNNVEVVRINNSSQVGINTTNPVATLQVKDALAFETTNTTTTSTSQVAVDTFATATFRSAKYQVQMTCPGQLATLGGITTGGSGYTAGTFNITFSNSSGTGAAAQGTLTISNGTVSQIGLGTTGGSGYTAGDVLTAAGGSGLQVSVASTASPSGRILTLGAITSAGIGYTSGVGVGTTTLTFLGGTGTGAVGLATIFDGVITSSTLLQQPTTGTGGTTYYSGSNYTTATVLTIAKTDVTNTITDISGSVGVSTFTSLTAHGIGVSDTVRVSSTSNGLTAGTNYFVVTTPTTTTFTLGSSVGIGTTFTTGSSLSIGFYRNSANAGGSVAYLNAITGVSTNFQVSDLMVLQNGTTADFVEYGTIANNDVLGTFAADISGANTRLLVTPTYATNTVKVARQAITV